MTQTRPRQAGIIAKYSTVPKEGKKPAFRAGKAAAYIGLDASKKYTPCRPIVWTFSRSALTFPI